MRNVITLSLGFASGILLLHLFLVPVIAEWDASVKQQIRDQEQILFMSRQHSYEVKKVRGTPLRLNLSSEPSITLSVPSPYRDEARDAIRIYLTDQMTIQEYDDRDGMIGLWETDASILQELSPESLVSISYIKRDERFYATRISVTYR